VTFRNGSDVADTTFRPSFANAFSQAAVSWSAGPAALPDGISVDASNGRLKGAPTGYVASRSFPGNVLVATDATDGAKATSDAYAITVHPTLGVVPATASATVRAGKSATLASPAVSGLVGTPAWSLRRLSGPSLTATFSPVGAATISAPASASGLAAVGLRLVDGADGAETVSDPVAVTVVPATTVTYAANTPVIPGQTVEIRPGVGNAQGALRYEIASGGPLPAGIALDRDTGFIRGSTNATGTVTVTVAATDVDGYVASSNPVRIAVSNAPDVFLGAVPPAKVGRPYALTPTSNASGPTWTLTGTLPASLSVNPTTGAVIGTPSVAGTSGTLVLNARDTVKAVTGSSEAFAIAVAPGNVVALALAPSKWRVGLASTARFGIENAIGAVSWTLSSGRLPDGVTLNAADGTISGTPTQYGSFSPVLLATDSEGTRATYAYAIAVGTGPTLAYQTATIQPSVPVEVNPVPQNVLGTPAYRVLSGTLPAGLSVSPTSGALVGRSDAVTASPVTVVVELRDGSDGAVALASLSVMVTDTAFYVDSGGSAFSATVGQPFSMRPNAYVQAQILQKYVSWSLTGTLPQGLSFDATTGAIFGTPAAEAVGTTTLSLSALYDQKPANTPSFTLNVADRIQPTADVPSSSYTLSRGVPFRMQPTVLDAVGNVAWSVTPGSGGLPVGLALNDATGLVSGTPTQNGTYAFGLTARDATKTATTPAVAVTVRDGMAVTVNPITSNDRVGQVYLANLQAPGATGAVTWTLVPEGSLPNGIALDASAGTLSGTPTTNGSWPVTVRATDSLGAVAMAQATIVIAPRPAVGAVPSLQVLANKAMNPYAPISTNAQGSVAWLAVGDFPPGVKVDPADGTISGTPTQAGSYARLQLRMTDNGGSGLASLSAPFAITVAPVSATLSATMVPSVTLRQGEAARLAPVVSGTSAATQSYKLQSYSYNSSTSACNTTIWCWNDAYRLPAGLGFDAATGTISGVPTTYYPDKPAGQYTPSATAEPASAYRIVVTDNRSPPVGVTSNQFTITIAPWNSLSVSTPPSYALTRGESFAAIPTIGGAIGTLSYKLQSYSYNSAASACNTTIWCWNDAYKLPAGLGFDAATGRISGVPTTYYPDKPTGQYTPSATTVPASAYRIVATEIRKAGSTNQSIEATSNEFTLPVSDWTLPDIALPQTQELVRGRAISIAPIMKGVTGNLSYKLQAYGYNSAASGCNTTTWCWNDAPTLPAGLSFDAATGTISGVPTTYYPDKPTGQYTPSATTVPASAYRIVATEVRKAGASTQTIEVTSNQMTLPVANWIEPTVTVDPTPLLVRGVAADVIPTVTGASGTLSYKLQSYSYNSAASACNTTTWCWNDAPNLPAGLSFNAATGTISGVPTTYYPDRSSGQYTPSSTTAPALAYRIVASETRKAGASTQTIQATSNSINLAVAEWPLPTVVLPPRLDYTVNQFAKASPDTKGVIGSVTYRLQAYGYNSSTSACNSSSWCWNNGPTLPVGLTFNPATGEISGTPTRHYTGAPNGIGSPSATTMPAYAYRIVATEVRKAGASTQTIEVTSNQIAISSSAAAASPVSLTYGNGNVVPARTNLDVAFAPTLSGAPAVTGSYSLSYVKSTVYNSTGDYNTSSLPPGMSFSTVTGTISGSPTAGNPGNWNGYQVCAPTAAGSACALVTIALADRPPLTIDVTPFPKGTVQQSIDPVVPVVGNGFGTVSYELVSGLAKVVAQGEILRAALPPGLVFDKTTGTISGTPTAAGTYRGYGVVATDADKARYKASSGEIVFRIDPQPTFTLSAPAVVDIQPNVASFPAVAAVPAGAYGKVTWDAAALVGKTSAVSGFSGTYATFVTVLPSGLSYDAASGSISGTPAGNLPPGYYRGYQICGTDELARTACTPEIVLRNVPKDAFAVAAQSFVTVRQGESLTVRARALNPVGAVTWGDTVRTGATTAVANTSIVPGEFVQALPAGITYDKATGTISGTVGGAVAIGRYRGYAITAKDTQSASVETNEIVIEVTAAEPLAIDMRQITDVTKGTAFTLVPQVTGALGTFTFATTLTTGGTSALNGTNGDFVTALPPNVAYSPSDGSVGGTAAGAATGRWRGYKVCGRDVRGTVCSAEFVLNVQ
jgi:hypothetical protein